jgi:hypothetical protein
MPCIRKARLKKIDGLIDMNPSRWGIIVDTQPVFIEFIELGTSKFHKLIIERALHEAYPFSLHLVASPTIRRQFILAQ